MSELQAIVENDNSNSRLSAYSFAMETLQFSMKPRSRAIIYGHSTIIRKWPIKLTFPSVTISGILATTFNSIK